MPTNARRSKQALTRLSKICSALPNVEVTSMNSHARFVVKRKTFAYFLDDHHGDGRLALNAKAPPGENVRLSKEDPERFFLPAYLTQKGWIGLRLDTKDVDWVEVADLVTASYSAVAPKERPVRPRPPLSPASKAPSDKKAAAKGGPTAALDDDPRWRALLEQLARDPMRKTVDDHRAPTKTQAGGRLGATSLKRSGKIIAMSVRGDLVVKLSKARVDVLVREGVGVRFEPGPGRVMKEWLRVAGTATPWLALLREAHDLAG